MNVLKVIGFLGAAGITGAISCFCSKSAGDEIRNKDDVVDIPEMDDVTEPETVED